MRLRVPPHKILFEEGYHEDTQAEFRGAIKHSGVKGRVVPLIMSSEEAARSWHKPTRLFKIDGDRHYQAAKLEITLWEYDLVEGDIHAMHDTIRKSAPSAG